MRTVFTIKSFVKTKMPKEYFCHIQFVKLLTDQLIEQYNPENKLELKIAALLHDIGRTKEVVGEHHSATGSKMLPDILKKLKLESKINSTQSKLIQNLIASHNAKIGNSLEEKILITADSLSKVQYHEAFMLLCKKPTFQERAKWGLKYLNKGYERLQFEEIKNRFEGKYQEINLIYQKVLNEN